MMDELTDELDESKELIVATYVANHEELRNAITRVYTGVICGKAGEWLLTNIDYNIEWPMLRLRFVNLAGQQHPFYPCNLARMPFVEWKESDGFPE